MKTSSYKVKASLVDSRVERVEMPPHIIIYHLPVRFECEGKLTMNSYLRKGRDTVILSKNGMGN